MHWNRGGNSMYDIVFGWVITICVRCCCNNGGNACSVGSLLLEVNRLGPPYVFCPTLLKLLVVSTETKIANLAFLFFSAI